MLRAKLLEFIVCPSCLGRLAPVGEDELVCRNPACRRAYGVIHGRIPNLVEDESRELTEEVWREKLAVSGLDARAPDDRRKDRRRPAKSRAGKAAPGTS